MIRHIVMWRLRGDTSGEKEAARRQVQGAFEGLRGRIPGMLHLEVGVDRSGVEYACDVVLVSEFVDDAALAAYATHPDHVRVRKELGDLRIARHQVDYIISDAAILNGRDRATP
jgi:quinol monooxygenase YgiN